MTWTEAVETYFRDQDLSELTVVKYRTAFAQFHEWYLHSYREEPEPGMLTNEEMREWRGYLQSRPKTVQTKDGERQTEGTLSPSTINGYLTAMRRLCHYHNNPLRVTSLKRVTPPVEILTARDRGRLLKTLAGKKTPLNLRNVAMASLMVRAGLRVSEVIGLQVNDVEINERSGWVTIRADVGKGRKERRVPLSKEARHALNAFLDMRDERWPDTGVLFPSKTGQPLDSRVVQRLVKRAAIKTGIKQTVTPHTLRHTFATEYLRRKDTNGQGVLLALATLQKLLGHESIATTSRYLHPSAADLQRMIEDM